MEIHKNVLNMRVAVAGTSTNVRISATCTARCNPLRMATLRRDNETPIVQQSRTRSLRIERIPTTITKTMGQIVTSKSRARYPLMLLPSASSNALPNKRHSCGITTLMLKSNSMRFRNLCAAMGTSSERWVLSTRRWESKAVRLRTAGTGL
eukprot:3960713-Prymnesium_polylepis.1